MGTLVLSDLFDFLQRDVTSFFILSGVSELEEPADPL